MSVINPHDKVKMYEQAIENLVTDGVSSYNINGRSFTLHDVEKLERMLAYWQSRSAEYDHGFVTYSYIG